MTEADKQCQAWLEYFQKCGMGIQDLKNIRKHDGEQMLVMVLKRLKLSSALDLVKACEK